MMWTGIQVDKRIQLCGQVDHVTVQRVSHIGYLTDEGRTHYKGE